MRWWGTSQSALAVNGPLAHSHAPIGIVGRAGQLGLLAQGQLRHTFVPACRAWRTHCQRRRPFPPFATSSPLITWPTPILVCTASVSAPSCSTSARTATYHKGLATVDRRVELGTSEERAVVVHVNLDGSKGREGQLAHLAMLQITGCTALTVSPGLG